MSTSRKYRPWVRVTNGAMLVNGICAGCYFYLGPNWQGNMGRPKYPVFIESMPTCTLIGFIQAGRLWLAWKIKQEVKGG